jgi:Cu-Zn family superoxide dismutase
MFKENFPYFISLLLQKPQAQALLDGSPKHPRIRGKVTFFQTSAGVLVSTEVMGLPNYSSPCESSFLGYHIHQGSSCTGNSTDPFANAQAHLNPLGCTHPHHAGDMPPLLNNQGYAFSMFLTDRFSIDEIIGSTVIIHDMPDDFRTQPAGDSGQRIACGVITRAKK